MTLGTRIREIVGSCSTSHGRGQTWLYVGERRGTKARNAALIKKLSKAFETWKMVRHCEHRCPASYPGMDYGMPEGTLIRAWVATDYHFVVRTKTGKALGFCHVSADYSKGSYLIINMHQCREDEVEAQHEYNRTYKDIFSYTRVG